MLIVCPNCSTSYAIEPGSLGSEGRTVRCARCKTTWFADASAAEVPAVAEAASEASDAYESPGVIRPDRGTGPGGGDVALAEEHMAAPDDPAREASPILMPAAIADAPSLVPAIEPAGIPAGSEPDEIENFTVRRKRLQARRKRARRSSRWTALILVLFAF